MQRRQCIVLQRKFMYAYYIRVCNIVLSHLYWKRLTREISKICYLTRSNRCQPDDAMTMCPRPMCPRTKVLGQCVLWMPRPLNESSLQNSSQSHPNTSQHAASRSWHILYSSTQKATYPTATFFQSVAERLQNYINFQIYCSQVIVQYVYVRTWCSIFSLFDHLGSIPFF